MATNISSALNNANTFTTVSNHIVDGLTTQITMPFKITASTFALDDKGYIKLALRIDPTESKTEGQHTYKFVSAEIREAAESVYVNMNPNNEIQYTTDVKNSTAPHLTSQIQYVIHVQYSHKFAEMDQAPADVYHTVYIEVPQLQLISPYQMSYEPEIMLTESGTYDWSLNIKNPFGTILTGKFEDALENKFSSNETDITVNYRFTIENVGSKTFQVELADMNNIAATGTTNWNTGYLYFFWYDAANNYHAVYNKTTGTHPKNTIIVQNKKINLDVKLVDNSHIFSLVNKDLYPVKNGGGQYKWYLKDTTKAWLTVIFNYSAVGTNTFKIKLYDSSRQNGTVFIDKSYTYTSPGTRTITVGSEPFTKAEVVNMKLEITDAYNRKLEYDFKTIQIFDYNRPKIRSFDAFFSNAAGSLDLQSTHFTAQTRFDYTPLNGDITLTQSLSANGTTINPSFVSGQLKYIPGITLPLAASDYDVVFTITDSLGNSDSVTFKLSRKGGVLLDFNNTGYGMAIGKLSESNTFEVNFPTIFFNKVSYADGSRQTGDAATNLGFKDSPSCCLFVTTTLIISAKVNGV